jgi:hypothetical protein
VATPILAPAAKGKLWEILNICLRDQRQAWVLQNDGTYVQLRPGDASDEDGLKHAKAVPSNSPEGQQATEIATTLGERLKTKKRAEDEAAQAASDAEKAQTTAVQELQEELRNRGYDLTVAKSEKSGEIIITSGYFTGTDNRVKFLSFNRAATVPGASPSRKGNARATRQAARFGS